MLKAVVGHIRLALVTLGASPWNGRRSCELKPPLGTLVTIAQPNLFGLENNDHLRPGNHKPPKWYWFDFMRAMAEDGP
jgi:hypothetical protein